MSEFDVVDRGTLDSLLESVGGDREFLGELAAEYFGDASRQFEAMRQALADGDADVLRRSAHSLKSNSATFGAMALSEMCRELEYRARDGILAGAGERIDRAETEFVAVRDALREATGA